MLKSKSALTQTATREFVAESPKPLVAFFVPIFSIFLKFLIVVPAAEFVVVFLEFVEAPVPVFVAAVAEVA